ncbi:hypothetical protein EGW08_013422 [Elysia chlorotica]|uniref:Uncharacterized protein n=1 Tax=Elysia chlorotica TaxID=188477 RepID=A0A433TBJ7_ELYCH|nr:hypothetical protein EGW08_013422 [Elysia chlorotica]
MSPLSTALKFEPETSVSDNSYIFRTERGADLAGFNGTTVNVTTLTSTLPASISTSTETATATSLTTPISTSLPTSLPTLLPTSIATSMSTNYTEHSGEPNSTLFTLTSEFFNASSTIMGSTKPHGDDLNTTATAAATTENSGDGGSNMGGTIAAVSITIILVTAFVGGVVYLYLRRRWKPHQKSAVCFQPIRKRRSSTSDSRRTLEELEEEPDKSDMADQIRLGGGGSRRQHDHPTGGT